MDIKASQIGEIYQHPTYGTYIVMPNPDYEEVSGHTIRPRTFLFKISKLKEDENPWLNPNRSLDDYQWKKLEMDIISNTAEDIKSLGFGNLLCMKLHDKGEPYGTGMLDKLKGADKKWWKTIMFVCEGWSFRQID